MNDNDDTLWDVNDLARYMKLSPSTIQANASRAPDTLPPRVANLRALRWVPSVCREWVLPTKAKGGRKRLEA